ncbi:MAG TPA: hypothetical protein VG432_08150 [Gemmatimonadaceae bacterium]|nr:hypothetical protein [Gemmatimonadaceae bacterium]
MRLSADGHAEVPGDLEARVMHAVFGPEVMAASFVDVLAERDPERLAELGRLVRRKLRDQGRGKEKA